MNELVVSDEVIIENMIYEIRGKQVMLDSDLAKLYKCVNGTKTINQAVSRHKERFPDDFYFQLIRDEYYNILRSQLGTLELSQGQYNKYLPYVDNWATCDQMSPKVFKKHKEDLLKEIKVWIKSKKPYTIRFGIDKLMQLYLDEDFKEEYLKLVSNIKSNEYYVNMVIAWFFATALAKQYDTTIKYIENRKLDTWVHNKTIQKAVESYRITPEQKEYLRSLRIK